jgi:peptide/nickel transport system substrate-binding protein
MRVHSEREFSLSTEKPVGRLEAVLAEFPFVIYGEREGGRFVGTGRYMVPAAMAAEPGKPLRLVPNPYHWQGVAQRDVLISRVTSSDLLMQGLEFGEVDLAFNVPPAEAARLAADPRFTLHRTLVAYQYMLLVNTRSAALADVKVRRALALAVDREALVRRVEGEPARGLYPSVWPFALAKPLAYDPAQARRLLDEAGWRAGADGLRQKDGQPLQLRLMHYAQRPDFGLLAPLLAQQLAAVGVRVAVEASPNVNDTMARRDFDLAFWTMNTAPGGDPTYVLDQYFSSLGTINYSNWQSLDFDEALAAARQAREAQAVSVAVATVERLLAEEVPAIFLITPRWVTVSNERVRGYLAYPSDYYIVNGSIR